MNIMGGLVRPPFFIGPSFFYSSLRHRERSEAIYKYCGHKYLSTKVYMLSAG